MQEEEQLSISEILSSIRQVLSKEIESSNTEPISHKEKMEPKKEPQLPILPKKEDKKEEFVLELTPQMRVASQPFLSANQFQNNTDLNLVVETEIKPFLHTWLNQNLPDIVEKVVTREVQRIINLK